MNRDMISRVDPHQPISGASKSRVDWSCEAIVAWYPGKPGISDLIIRDVQCVFLAGQGVQKGHEVVHRFAHPGQGGGGCQDRVRQKPSRRWPQTYCPDIHGVIFGAPPPVGPDARLHL